MLSRANPVRWLLAAGLGLACLGCGLGNDLTFRHLLLQESEPQPQIREYKTLAEPQEEAAPPQTWPGANPAPAVVQTAENRGGPAEMPRPAPAPAAADPLRQLYQRAAERYAGIDSYIARLRRREQVNGTDKPEELLLFRFRKQPWSVYFKWLGTEGKGREAAYVKGQHEDKIHTLTAAGDIPFSGGGQVIAVAPDSILVRSRSRHPITEAGIGSIIEHFGQMLARRDKDGTCPLRYAGTQKRPEYAAPLEVVEQTIPSRSEDALPGGGRRFFYFDPANGLPVLIIAKDRADHEVEYYCYDRIEYPVKLDDGDFDPDKLWGKR
jgi:hypothetical protein